MKTARRKKRTRKRRRGWICFAVKVLLILVVFLLAVFIYRAFVQLFEEAGIPAYKKVNHSGNILPSQTDFSSDSDGRMRYCGSDPDISSISGIDVSEFQGYIDWEKVAESGIEFAYIRVGLRGSETGKIVPDTLAVENLQEAAQNGIRTGVYFYSQAVNTQEAIEEAEYTLDMIRNCPVTECVAIDIEEPTSSESRTYYLESTDYTAVVNAFSKTIADAGYRPMVYGNRSTYLLMLDCTDLDSNIAHWYAYHSNDLLTEVQFDIWQYDAHGQVDGIDAEVDLDVMLEKNTSCE